MLIGRVPDYNYADGGYTIAYSKPFEPHGQHRLEWGNDSLDVYWGVP